MSLISAINADNKSIPTGSPVAGKESRFQLDRVVMAGGSVLAAGIVKSGSIVGGVINIYTEGIVDIPNWSLVSDSKYLSTGKTYRLASQPGKITTSGNGQVIGLAISRQQLSLQLSSGGGTSSTSVVTGSLATETADRITADNMLTAQIYSESNSRVAGDSVLQSGIDALSASTVICGSVAIGNGIDTGSVTGLGLSWIPTAVILTVRIPLLGLKLFAVVMGDPTADGFNFALSGMTDSFDYKLDYALIP